MTKLHPYSHSAPFSVMSCLSGATTPSPKSKAWNCPSSLPLRGPKVSDLQIMVSSILGDSSILNHQHLRISQHKSVIHSLFSL